MNTETFEHIVCQSGAGRPASIRFFGRITEESAGRFSEAFDFLENIVRPSLIRVLINSEGGSVLHGMTVYAAIQNARCLPNASSKAWPLRWAPLSGLPGTSRSCGITGY